MATKKTSPEIATIAGRILRRYRKASSYGTPNSLVVMADNICWQDVLSVVASALSQRELKALKSKLKLEF